MGGSNLLAGLLFALFGAVVGTVLIIFRVWITDRQRRLLIKYYGGFGRRTGRSLTPGMAIAFGIVFYAFGAFVLIVSILHPATH